MNNPNNRYITNIINSEEGLIIRKDRPIEQKKYIILEYCEGRALIDFLVGSNNHGFGELLSKLIFIKIFNAVKLCHDNGICHRDIKPDNILLDEKYNPKLCDFGHATENKDNLKEFENIGTKEYKAPEILKGKPYDGFKADIFSLGKTLVEVAHGKYVFKYANEKDVCYKYIIEGNTDIIKGLKTLPGITSDFIDLYMKMVSYDPERRPNIEQILNHHWFKEIYEMEDKMKIDLEEKLKLEFEKRLIEAKKQWRITIDKENNNSDIANSKSRSFSDKEQKYFIKQIEPKYIKGEINHCDYIKIKGFLQPNIFIYDLCEELDKKLKDLCIIVQSEEK